MRRQDQLRWLLLLADQADSLGFPLFGYHSVEVGWSVDLPAGVPEDLVYLVVAGSCHGAIDGRKVRLDPGSALWLRPRLPFALTLSDPLRPITLYRFRLAMENRPEAADAGRGRASEVMLIHDGWELRGTFDLLVSELAGSLPLRDQRVRALLTVLFTGMFRLAERAAGGGRALSEAQRRQLEAYVDAHIAERPTPDELASVIGLSPDYFARRFRRTFAVAPKSWLVRRRIQRAALRLDESRDSITRIAESLGYPDVFLFSRQFKSIMGLPPTAYRSR